MNLGFIGTGKIAYSVITGICTSKISFKKIIISQSVKDEIGDLYKTRKLDAIKVKGKRKPVEIFKVLT